MASSKCALQFLQKTLQARVLGGGFEQHLSGIKLLLGGDGKCSASFKVEPEHKNVGGTLHGGLTATLVDCISTLALMTTDKGKPGSSIDLSVSFMRPAHVGDSITIEAETLKVGKSLAFLEIFIKDEISGKILATGKHTKFIG